MAADVLTVLASRSPRRIELLTRAGVTVTVDPADIDESQFPGESATGYVSRMAASKLSAVVDRHHGATVIAADTTVDLDGEILGQPADDDDARRILGQLSGRTHTVRTAVAVGHPDGTTAHCVVETLVTFRPLGARDISWYVATGEPAGKAGAYAVQGLGMALVSSVRGSLSNVVGLPVGETLALLGR